MSRFSRLDVLNEILRIGLLPLLIEVLNEGLQIGMKNYLGRRARTRQVGDEIVSQIKKQQI
jgi:hypothetical protein